MPGAEQRMRRKKEPRRRLPWASSDGCTRRPRSLRPTCCATRADRQLRRATPGRRAHFNRIYRKRGQLGRLETVLEEAVDVLDPSRRSLGSAGPNARAERRVGGHLPAPVAGVPAVSGHRTSRPRFVMGSGKSRPCTACSPDWSSASRWFVSLRGQWRQAPAGSRVARSCRPRTR